MPSFHTIGIVLRVQNQGEQDRRAHLYTREHGKLDLFVKSGRKMQSKLAPHLEPLTVAECFIVRGRRDHLVAIERQDRLGGARGNLQQLAMIAWAAELVDAFTKFDHPDQRIFHLLEFWCVFVERFGDGRLPERWRCLFLVSLLGYLGIGPECNICVRCKKSDEPAWLFSARDGGIICERCPHHPEGIFSLLETERLVLAEAPKQEQRRWSLIESRALKESTARMLIEALLAEHGDIPIRSEQFLRWFDREKFKLVEIEEKAYTSLHP
ncbi:DNA repair protein RecO [Candidatus Uhrbacteria bacterium]|nr:DNA repair protein RecO [Candidatus Uhrbacteria bacterium]